jgi:hypothetical protein
VCAAVLAEQGGGEIVDGKGHRAPPAVGLRLCERF